MPPKQTQRPLPCLLILSFVNAIWPGFLLTGGQFWRPVSEQEATQWRTLAFARSRRRTTYSPRPQPPRPSLWRVLLTLGRSAKTCPEASDDAFVAHKAQAAASPSRARRAAAGVAAAQASGALQSGGGKAPPDTSARPPSGVQAAARVADLGAAQSQQVGPGDGHSQPVNLVDPVWKTLEHLWKRGSWRHGIESRHLRNYRTGYNCMSLYTLKKYIKSKIG